MLHVQYLSIQTFSIPGISMKFGNLQNAQFTSAI